jgi:hypothetical protein
MRKACKEEKANKKGFTAEGPSTLLGASAEDAEEDLGELQINPRG